MPRSNQTGSLAQWIAAARDLPYRASISGNCDWDVGRPSHHMAGALRVSPGGRILLAFAVSEVRDYFVLGHIDQGAQVEDDFAPQATTRSGRPPEPKLPEDYETAVVDFENALRHRTDGEKAIEAAFVEPMRALLFARRTVDAVALWRSMPDTVSKTLAFGELKQSGQWDFDKVKAHTVAPTPYDAQRGAALVSWQRSRNAMERIEQRFDELARERAEDILRHYGHEALMEFVDSVPNSIGKVNLKMFVRRTAPATQPMSSGPSPR